MAKRHRWTTIKELWDLLEKESKMKKEATKLVSKAIYMLPQKDQKRLLKICGSIQIHPINLSNPLIIIPCKGR